MGNDAKPDIQSIRKQAFQRYIAGHAGKWVEPEALFIVAMIQTEQNEEQKETRCHHIITTVQQDHEHCCNV